MRCSTPIRDMENGEGGDCLNCDVTIIEKAEVGEICNAMADINVKSDQSTENEKKQ